MDSERLSRRQRGTAVVSYRQELRDAELMVIRSAESLAKAIDEHGPPPAEQHGLLRLSRANMRIALDDLDALRSQLDAPIVPSSDDDTSANAARMALPMVAGLRRKIVYAVAKHERYPVPGCTDDMLERITQRSHQSVSSARRSLVQMGWLRDSGQRENTRTGRGAVKWVLTGFGKDQVVTLALMKGSP